MKPEMVFNDLSLQPQVGTEEAARQLMGAFVNTLVAATKVGAARVLHTPRHLLSSELTSGYPLSKWCNDDSADREQQRYFLTLATKPPFLDETTHPATEEEDVLCAGQQAMGLALARMLGALAISVLTDSFWEVSNVELKVVALDLRGDILERAEWVRHASLPSHIKDHEEWIRNQGFVDVLSGMDLWDRRRELFPALNFCKCVEENVRVLKLGDVKLRPVIERLLDLHTYSQTWHLGPFNPDALPARASKESSATMQAYGQDRTFQCPDGAVREFPWHVRVTPGAWRIHFLPRPQEILIGYIGPHLRTVSDPT